MKKHKTSKSNSVGRRSNFKSPSQKYEFVMRIKDSNLKILRREMELKWQRISRYGNTSRLSYFLFMLALFPFAGSFNRTSHIQHSIHRTALKPVFIYKRFQLSSGGKPFRIGYRTTYHRNLPPTGNWQLLHSER